MLYDVSKANQMVTVYYFHLQWLVMQATCDETQQNLWPQYTGTQISAGWIQWPALPPLVDGIVTLKKVCLVVYFATHSSLVTKTYHLVWWCGDRMNFYSETRLPSAHQRNFWICLKPGRIVSAHNSFRKIIYTQNQPKIVQRNRLSH